MVLPELLALLVTIIVAWGLIRSLANLLGVIVNIFWGLLVLMFWVLLQIWNLIYNTWWHVASAANDLIAYIWSGVCLPFQFLLHVIKHFGLLLLTTTHLILRILYYVFLLWTFTYLLMLLYRFITRRDWAIQLEFYMGPTPRNDNLRQDGRTLTIAPVLLDNNRRQCLNPPHII